MQSGCAVSIASCGPLWSISSTFRLQKYQRKSETRFDVDVLLRGTCCFPCMRIMRLTALCRLLCLETHTNDSTSEHIEGAHMHLRTVAAAIGRPFGICCAAERRGCTTGTRSASACLLLHALLHPNTVSAAARLLISFENFLKVQLQGFFLDGCRASRFVGAYQHQYMSALC